MDVHHENMVYLPSRMALVCEMVLHGEEME
jgi:hypothetical protein